MRIGYPTYLNKSCICCNSPVEYAYPDDGKMVRTLEGIVYQIVNYFKCSNPDCKLHKIPFNPSPRIDYSNRHFGADVFKFVSEEFLCYDQKPKQILQRLTDKCDLKISIDTIQRMCNDALILKSLKIDERTKQIIMEQGFILLGFDGQDPGSDEPAIWSFKDMITNRILATYKFESLDYMILHDTIEEIINIFGVKIIGWVTDKQNTITKCHDTYYTDIPHQYCQYHFLKNTWSHLIAFDSNLFLPLKKAINDLYIHKASKTAKINFENVGKISVREAFKDINKTLQSMIRIRNKRFKELRGIWLFEILEKYVANMDEILSNNDPSYRFSKILSRTAEDLHEALEELRDTYKETLELNDYFKLIHHTLYIKKFKSISKQESKLEVIYEKIFDNAVKEEPTMRIEDCKSFLANKKATKLKIMGEWCRLWNSYRRGLFVYSKFPVEIKTNNSSENGFSREKQAIINQVAKGMVDHMISTRGEYYLRIKHCIKSELQEDIIAQYTEEVVRTLRLSLKEDIKKSRENWRIKKKIVPRLKIEVGKYYVLENTP